MAVHTKDNLSQVRAFDWIACCHVGGFIARVHYPEVLE